MPPMLLPIHSVPNLFSVVQPSWTPKGLQLKIEDMPETASQSSVDDIKSNATSHCSEQDPRMSLSSRSIIMGSNCDERFPQLKGGIKSRNRVIEKCRKADSNHSSNSSGSFCHSNALQKYVDAAIEGEEESSDFVIRKKAFILSLMETCSRRGCLTCRLCHVTIWGPNGMVLQLPDYRTCIS